MKDFDTEVTALRAKLAAASSDKAHSQTVAELTTAFKNIRRVIETDGIVIKQPQIVGGGGVVIGDGDTIEIGELEKRLAVGGAGIVIWPTKATWNDHPVSIVPVAGDTPHVVGLLEKPCPNCGTIVEFP